MSEYGTLYGIGVGPGDPELITLKAVKILQRVACVFAAASPRNSHSLAEKTISPHLRKETPVVRLNFPMTRNLSELRGAWEENARKIMEVVGMGKDAALITLGDPMTYSTFGYMMRTMSEENPLVPIHVVPGITSFQAASAATGWVLAEGEESFTVVSGALGAARLGEVIEHTDTVVILKVYHHYKEIMDALRRLDLSGRSVLVSQCGLKDEKIVWDPMDNVNGLPPYLSLLLIRKKKR
ncbi:MAG: precorrin-2 C(20)-methyltransferase [Desulfobacteraceae bacterium]|nr:MAG: precorrin-2 C(20)-methyltransferase [Desulfobacteraceae bacterium]